MGSKMGNFWEAIGKCSEVNGKFFKATPKPEAIRK
jgi:hypothetical protein